MPQSEDSLLGKIGWVVQEGALVIPRGAAASHRKRNLGIVDIIRIKMCA
jgi:diketogulonate reductase-like aldo/keto reductase